MARWGMPDDDLTDGAPLRFYGDLAPWWPLLSPLDEYAEEAAYAARLLGAGGAQVQHVLELGSGGGHMAHHLSSRFDLVLVDLSPAMLAVSQRLNPTLEHLQGDMRAVRVGRTFDAVFVHDAIAYLTTEADLRAAMATAFVHCRPGGVVVLMPDETTEVYEPSCDAGGSDAPDGRGAHFLQWSWDPDPADSTTVTEYAFLLRDRDGTVHHAHDHHVLGLFPRATWLRLLADVGFAAEHVVEETTEDRTPRDVFVCRRPLEPADPARP